MRAISKVDLRYSAARFVNMAVRPAIISAAAYFFGRASAEQVSIIIFSVAIAMLLMCIDPHRAYYKKHFSQQNSAHEFTIYLIIIVTWMSLISAVMFTALVIHHTPVPISVLAVMMFVGEKVADESLRYCLFKKDLTKWSNLVITRAGVQLSGLAFSILLHSFPLLLISFTLSWAFPFYRPLKYLLSIIRKNDAVFFGLKFYRKAGSKITASAFLMASSLMSSSPSYFDKIVTLVADKASLPLFLIASMCFSLVQVFVDFFFVSRIRLELLQNSISLGHMLFSRKLFYCVVVGLGASAAVMAIEILFLKNVYSFDLAILILVAAINIILAMTTIPQQIVYWRDGPPGIFLAELGFFLPVTILYLSLIHMRWTLTSALAVLTLGLAVRFVSYVLVSQHSAIVGSLLTAMGRRDR